MFRFPFTNFHELNLDWILAKVKEFSELIPPMQTAVEDVQEALTDATEAITKSEEALENANEAVETANDAKEIAEQAAQGVIADGAVTTSKLANGAVTYNKIGDEAVATDKITNGAVTTAKLANGAVTNAKIENGAISAAKLDAALQSVIISTNAVPIPNEGASADYTLTGLTEDHVVIFWGFSLSPENNPPCDITITTRANGFTVSTTSGNSTESLKPIFAKTII